MVPHYLTAQTWEALTNPSTCIATSLQKGTKQSYTPFCRNNKQFTKLPWQYNTKKPIYEHIHPIIQLLRT